ncbi:hypothetical protein F4801DRAFT_577798 [Xylaria longipes]|nr:hypothetical protein F4801DRAFT_577798 [Xylaria longipes]
MYIPKLLLPAMLALRGLAQATASSDEVAIGAPTELSPYVGGGSRPQEPDSPSDAIAGLIAEDDSEEEPAIQELSARDPAALERRRWCRRGERWHRRWHRCYLAAGGIGGIGYLMTTQLGGGSEEIV